MTSQTIIKWYVVITIKRLRHEKNLKKLIQFKDTKIRAKFMKIKMTTQHNPNKNLRQLIQYNANNPNLSNIRGWADLRRS